MRFRQCGNKNCVSYCKLYNLAEHSACPDCQVDNSFKEHNNIMVGLRAAAKGPLETYKAGDSSCFYMDMLVQDAQERLL